MPKGESSSRSGLRIPSDSLASLRRFVKDYPLIEVLGEIFQLEIILDASVVIQDLIWIADTRENPEARTNLQANRLGNRGGEGTEVFGNRDSQEDSRGRP